MPTELWDDGNTSNNDGWSSTCSIELGYSCTGGSSTSKDTCVAWSSGFYQDVSNPTSWITHCGDGLRAGSEAWDDLNTSNGDGCSSTCTIDSGYIWNGGSTTSKDTWTIWPSGYNPNPAKTLWETIWGDGLRVGSEAWDDSNILSGDGWSNTCSIETGYFCTGGSTTSKDIWVAWSSGFYQDISNPTSWITHCGDGKKAGSEAWDDSNIVNGDGWSNTWAIEFGYSCIGGSTTSMDTCVSWSGGLYQDSSNPSNWIPHCGDGKKAGSEVWDDSNTSNGDGCSSAWNIESGFSCIGGSTTTKDTCVFWSTGYYQDSSNPTSWITHCGDGLKAGSEAWDDSNLSNGDGWSSIWTIEINYSWVGGSTTSKDTCVSWSAGLYQDLLNPSNWIPHCGDGKRAGSETWDDSNTSNGDGWSSTCLIELGYYCTGGSTTSKDIWVAWSAGWYQDILNPTNWIAHCGDGLKAGSEECDDSNTSNGDGCSNSWAIESGYACSGGSTMSQDIWTLWANGFYPNGIKSQWITICGDNKRAGAEICDDGNILNGDGWSSAWTSIEAGYSWAGGSVTSKDIWIIWTLGYYQDTSNPLVWISHWGDGSKSGSELCDDGNIVSGDWCSSNWATIESGWIWVGGSLSAKDSWIKWSSGTYPNSSKTQWLSIWGDGLRALSEQWDDGNTINGDGWTSDWTTVEEDYLWLGGSSTSKDICSKWEKGFHQNSDKPPTKWITRCGDGIRAGNEAWDNGNINDEDGWAGNWMKIEDGWAWIIGNLGTADRWLKWEIGYSPSSDYTSCVSTEIPTNVQSMAVASAVTTSAGVSGTVMVSAFSSSSPSSSNSFEMINQVQLVILLPLIGAFLPQKVYDYMKSMKAGLLNLSFLPQNILPNLAKFESLFDFDQPNSFLYLLDLKSGSALVNILNLSIIIG